MRGVISDRDPTVQIAWHRGSDAVHAAAQTARGATASEAGCDEDATRETVT